MLVMTRALALLGFTVFCVTTASAERLTLRCRVSYEDNQILGVPDSGPTCILDTTAMIVVRCPPVVENAHINATNEFLFWNWGDVMFKLDRSTLEAWFVSRDAPNKSLFDHFICELSRRQL